MGLDTSHGAWHGAYSAFMRWRTKIATVAGIPPLTLMEGFFERDSVYDPFRDYAQKWPDSAKGIYEGLPIRWDSLKPSALHILLSHSDCDGEISPTDCAAIADELEKLLPDLPDEGGGHVPSYRKVTERFIGGCREAANKNEPLDFH